MFRLQNHIPNMNTKYDKIPRYLLRKRSRFDPGSPHDFDVSFRYKDWEELAKATNGTANAFNLFQLLFQVLLTQQP